MTAYNRENYIADAIESVIRSNYTNWELIVCDDRSADKTVEIAQSYALNDGRVKVYVNDINLGDYPNRNRAASYATGKYLKYLDSDDLIYYYGLEVMVNYMERFPEAGFGLASEVEEHRPFPICLSPREIYLEGFGRFDHFGRGPGSSIIKREVFQQVGGFSGRRMIGDAEFWLKCARYYPMVKYPFDLYWNRIHPAQESQSAYAKKQYEQLRKEVVADALNHPECPLLEIEKMQVRKKLRRTKLKQHVTDSIQKINRLIN
jgi:glycosyltransferase involved in cell wall biosynthesis